MKKLMILMVFLVMGMAAQAQATVKAVTETGVTVILKEDMTWEMCPSLW